MGTGYSTRLEKVTVPYNTGNRLQYYMGTSYSTIYGNKLQYYMGTGYGAIMEWVTVQYRKVTVPLGNKIQYYMGPGNSIIWE